MPDYSHAKIYAIRAPGTNELYIGSTVGRFLCRRLAQHRYNYKQYQEGKEHYRWSFKMLEKPGHYIELIETVQCNSIEELRKREGELIRTTPGCINWYVAGRTPADYEAEHREHMQEYRAQYYAKKKASQAESQN